MRWKDGLESAATVVLVVCAVIVTTILVRQEFFSSHGARSRRVKEWRGYIKGIERIGSPAASDTIVVFSDFQCPFCHQLALALERIESSGQASMLIVHRNLPISTIHPFARPAAIAGLCAARQGRFPEFYRSAFAQQDSLGSISWTALAVDAGISDSLAFATCLQDGSTAEALAADSADAASLKVDGTPALLIGERFIPGLIPDDSLLAAIRGIS
jgi:protein-disulfide isomerase